MPDQIETGTGPGGGADDRFREIAENVHEIFWILDASGSRLLYANPAYEQITGRSLEKLYADPRSWREAVHPDDRARLDEMALTQDHDVEFRIVRPDGHVRWIWARGAQIRDERGVVQQVVGVAEDITQRKRTEDALERSLALLRATLDATTDGILALDLDGRITLFNRRFVELLKIPDFIAIEAGQERTVWGHIRDQLEDPRTFIAEMGKLRQEPQSNSFDVVEFKDGRVFDRSSRPERIGERIVGRVWSFHDTTDRTNVERTLRHHTRRLELQNDVLLRLARQPIADPTDWRAAMEQVTEAAADVLEAERVGIWLFDEGNTRIRLRELFQRSTRQHSSGTVLSRDEAPSYFRALEEERALAVEDVAKDPRTRELQDHYSGPLGITSMLDAPVREGGSLVGVACIEQVGPARRWSVEDQSFAGSIADLVSIGIEASGRQQAAARVQFLARASVVLASSLDYRTTLSNVADLTVPTVADWCLVDIVEDGKICRVAAAHREPVKADLLRELERRYPPDWDSGQPAAVALRTGEAQFVPDTSDTMSQERRDPYHEELVSQLGLRSYMAVPLKAGERTLAAITLASTERSYDADDLAFAQDLAGRAATAIDNARLHERAQAASKAKSDFLAIMSHELRTPLSAVMGYTDLLEEGVAGPTNSEQKRQLQRIRLRSQDLLHVLDEMLAFSRTEVGRERLRIETIDLARLAQEVAAIARPLADERGLAFELHAPEEAVPFPTDQGKVKHILLSLLSNAAKFTEHGRIELDATRDGNAAVFRVRDTGQGIAREDQERIFEPFVQAEDAMTRETGGTGLGLAVARRLARLLGGDVELDSTSGKGSTFTVRLPAAPDGATTDQT